MRLIGLLITVLIMALLAAFFFKRFTTPELEMRQNVNQGVEKMEHTVEDYKQTVKQQETDLQEQLESIR